MGACPALASIRTSPHPSGEELRPNVSSIRVGSRVAKGRPCSSPSSTRATMVRARRRPSSHSRGCPVAARSPTSSAACATTSSTSPSGSAATGFPSSPASTSRWKSSSSTRWCRVPRARESSSSPGASSSPSPMASRRKPRNRQPASVSSADADRGRCGPKAKSRLQERLEIVVPGHPSGVRARRELLVAEEAQALLFHPRRASGLREPRRPREVRAEPRRRRIAQLAAQLGRGVDLQRHAFTQGRGTQGLLVPGDDPRRQCLRLHVQQRGQLRQERRDALLPPARSIREQPRETPSVAATSAWKKR